MRRRLGAIFLVAFALAACAGPRTNEVTVVSTTAVATTVPGFDTFISEARTLTFGTKDLASSDEDAILGLGNITCEGLEAGHSFGRVVQAYVASDAEPSSAEATALAKLALENICPEHLPTTKTSG